MDIYQLIEAIESRLDNSFEFFGVCFVDKTKVMDLLSEMRFNLPRDISSAKKITEECDRIKTEAQQQADRILKSADDRVALMVDEHELTKRAYEQANLLVEKAKDDARNMRIGANQYADSILETLENQLAKHLEEIRMGRNELKK